MLSLNPSTQPLSFPWRHSFKSVCSAEIIETVYSNSDKSNKPPAHDLKDEITQVQKTLLSLLLNPFPLIHFSISATDSGLEVFKYSRNALSSPRRTPAFYCCSSFESLEILSLKPSTHPLSFPWRHSFKSLCSAVIIVMVLCNS